MAATVILSLFFPGAGHIYTGAGIGVLILILWLLAVGLGFIPFVGWVISIPLGLGMFVWGLIGSILRCGKINRGEL